jgi:hypothetical protein
LISSLPPYSDSVWNRPNLAAIEIMSRGPALRSGDRIGIELRPTFSFISQDDKDPATLEYGDLPSKVQQQVGKFFQSDDFRVNTTEGYVLNEITSWGGSFPLNGRVNKVALSLDRRDDAILVVTLNATLVGVSGSGARRNSEAISLSDVQMAVEEGYFKMSNEGNITADANTPLYIGRRNENPKWPDLGDEDGQWWVKIYGPEATTVYLA